MTPRQGFLSTIAALALASQLAATAMAKTPVLKSGQADIYRDEWGVPHIYAAKEEDGFYALGYAQAQDQLQRFLLTVLAARGELAARVAPEDLPAPLRQMIPQTEVMIESDYQARLWRIHELSEAAVKRLDPQVRRNYAAFADGMMAYMRDHPEKTPAWAPRQISVADLVAAPQFSLWPAYQSGIGMLDCKRGGAKVISAAQLASGKHDDYSNEWAVMPSRTATGGAILLSDPHGGVDGRFVYEYRMHAGDLDLAGYAAGPFPLVSRNARVGWAVTTGSPDVADCYAVRTTSPENRSFLYDGEEKPIERAEITIAVKDGRVLHLSAAYTHHNGVLSPVVAEEPGKVFALSTPYIGNLEGMHNAYDRMARARTVDDFRAALDVGGVFPQNLMAADTNGDILYIHSGYVPVRPDPKLDWAMPQDGNSSATAWRGMHKAADLPTVRSPGRGFLQNDNVDPRLMDSELHAEFRGLPEYLLSEGWLPRDKPTTRALRTIHVLASETAMTEQDAFALVFDTRTELAQKWLALLSTALGEGGRDIFLADLLAFDGEMIAPSTAALKYVYWREALRARLLPEDVGELAAAFDEDKPLSAGLNSRLVMAVSDARKRMAEAGGNARTYGDEFRLGGIETRNWPNSGGSLEVLVPDPAKVSECTVTTLLCDTTLFPFSYLPTGQGNQRIAVTGSRMMRLDFYSPKGIRSFTVQNPGLSDDPASGHADDQAEKLMSQRRMKPVRFEWEDLAAHIVSHEHLVTGKRK